MEKTLSRRSVQIGGCTDWPPIRVSSTLPRESTLGRYIDDIILHTVCSTGARQKIKVILNIIFRGHYSRQQSSIHEYELNNGCHNV